MATVTVTVTLRRTEGKRPPDLDSLAQATAQAIADAGLEVECYDLLGEELGYEITSATAPTSEPTPLRQGSAEMFAQCKWCGAIMSDDPHGRQRSTCSDRCRQALHRHGPQR